MTECYFRMLGFAHDALMETAVSSVFDFMLTGVNEDYTTLTSKNCNGWTSVSGDTVAGGSSEMDAAFIHSEQVPVCDDNFGFYCIEQ